MSEVEQDCVADNRSADSKRAVESPLYALNYQQVNSEASELRRWWRRLVMDDQKLKQYTKEWPYPRGVRAALRRCDGIESVMTTEAFRHLWFALELRVWGSEPADKSRALRNQRLETWATIAAIVAELRDETFDVPMAQRLGENRPKTLETPRMSDLRFQQLLDCHEPVELIRRFRRALKLADGKGISVVRLADMVALWHRERHGQYRAEATERFAFIMSDGYFKGRSLKTAGTD